MNHSSLLINSKLAPIFRLSTFRNEDVLISESIKHVPLIRIIMVIICIIIGIGTLINLIIVYMKYKLRLKHNIFYRVIIPFILFLNILLHVSHYSHNIYDPAAYFEPKKLYLKIFITEMEQTFLFNFPLSILFIIGTQKLLLCCTQEQIKSLNMLIIVILYSLMSMVSGGHYTYEPPSNFSLLCNITIAGETIVALLLMIASYFVYRFNSNKAVNYRYARLTTNDNSDLQMSAISQRQFKSKLSDTESI